MHSRNLRRLPKRETTSIDFSNTKVQNAHLEIAFLPLFPSFLNQFSQAQTHQMFTVTTLQGNWEFSSLKNLALPLGRQLRCKCVHLPQRLESSWCKSQNKSWPNYSHESTTSEVAFVKLENPSNTNGNQRIFSDLFLL